MKVKRATAKAPGQGELFNIEQIAQIYKDNPDTPLDNQTLYRMVASRVGLPNEALQERVPIGQSGQKHNLVRRQIRWIQQSLKQMNVLCRVKGERGIWRLTEDAKRDLNAAKPGVRVLGFRTDLGVAILGRSGDIFKNLDQEVMLIVTSPPYAISKPRSYGNPPVKEIVQ